MLEISEETKAWFLKKSGYELGGDPYDDNWSDMELAYAYEQGRKAGHRESLIRTLELNHEALFGDRPDYKPIDFKEYIKDG